MVYNYCFNSVAPPSIDRDSANTVLITFLETLAYLIDEQEQIGIYSDFELREYILCDGYSISDAVEVLSNINPDLSQLFYELDEKVPFYYYIDEDEFDKICESTYSFKDFHVVSGHDTSFLGLVDLLDFGLISIASNEYFRTNTLSINSLKKDGVWSEHNIYNIFNTESATEFVHRYDEDNACFKGIQKTPDFEGWFAPLDVENKKHIKDKANFLYAERYIGGKPTSTKIKGTDYNIRELKFGSGHDTFGKIRVFYTFLSNRELVLLLGFIKHNNDYRAETRLAEQLIDQLETQIADDNSASSA